MQPCFSIYIIYLAYGLFSIRKKKDIHICMYRDIGIDKVFLNPKNLKYFISNALHIQIQGKIGIKGKGFILEPHIEFYNSNRLRRSAPLVNY